MAGGEGGGGAGGAGGGGGGGGHCAHSDRHRHIEEAQDAKETFGGGYFSGALKWAGTGVRVPLGAHRAVLLESDPSDVRSENRAQWALQRGVEVGWDAFKRQARTHSCSRAIQAMSTA